MAKQQRATMDIVRKLIAGETASTEAQWQLRKRSRWIRKEYHGRHMSSGGSRIPANDRRQSGAEGGEDDDNSERYDKRI